MANVKFTTDQNNAIVTNGTPLIVSAAAGSGKTAVLVERVMRMIVEGDVNITDLSLSHSQKRRRGKCARKSHAPSLKS